MSYRIEPGSILLAVDGSEHAERATHWAADQAFLEGRPSDRHSRLHEPSLPEQHGHDDASDRV